MNKMIQPHALRLDELMTTVLCEVEALLNSRPLISTEMTEVEEELMLNPGHFLIFRALKAPPRIDISKAKLSSLRRWQLVKHLFYEFERAWKGCYIQSLQAR